MKMLTPSSGMMIDKAVLRQLNKGIKEFKDSGIKTPSAIEKHIETLNDFYNKNHMRVKHGQFTTSDKFNTEQWDEYTDIVKSFINDSDVKFLGDYESILESGKFDKFKNTKGEKEIKDVQTLINRMDKLNDDVNGVKLTNLMSSNQIIEVFNFAEKHNISESDMIKTIIKKHGKGKKALYGDDLQKKIYESYQGKQKTIKGKMGNVSTNGGTSDGKTLTIKTTKSNTGRRKTKKKGKN